jgi:hypothetical protein
VNGLMRRVFAKVRPELHGYTARYRLTHGLMLGRA